MTQTKASNPANDVTDTQHQQSSAADRLRHRIRLAREAFGAERTRRSHPFTGTVQLDFLSLLAVGMPVTEITRMLGVASSTIYRRRQTNPEFAAEWAVAIEMRYAELEDRLHEIAMNSPLESRTGLRACEILLKPTNPRYRPTPRETPPERPPFPIKPFLGLPPSPEFPNRGLPPNWQEPEDTHKPYRLAESKPQKPQSKIATASPISPTQLPPAAAPFLAPAHGGKSDRGPSGEVGLGTRNSQLGTPVMSPISPTPLPAAPNPKSKILNPKSIHPWPLRRRLATG